MSLNDFIGTVVSRAIWSISPSGEKRWKRQSLCVWLMSIMFVCNVQREKKKKNRSQSNQSGYKYGFYYINKYFVNENSHSYDFHTMLLWCLFCDFDCFFFPMRIYDWISFEFYVSPSFRHLAISHLIHSLMLKFFRLNTKHNRMPNWWCSSTVSEMPENPSLFIVAECAAKPKQFQCIDEK